jgi:predicted membrane-bound spermidine synthase
MPGGYQFPIASAIHQDGRPTQPGTGTLYALDLLGGCAGALLLAAFLVPLLGFWNTAWMSAIIALAPAASVSFLGFNSARHRA